MPWEEDDDEELFDPIHEQADDEHNDEEVFNPIREVLNTVNLAQGGLEHEVNDRGILFGLLVNFFVCMFCLVG